MDDLQQIRQRCEQLATTDVATAIQVALLAGGLLADGATPDDAHIKLESAWPSYRRIGEVKDDFRVPASTRRWREENPQPSPQDMRNRCHVILTALARYAGSRTASARARQWAAEVVEINSWLDEGGL